MTQVQPLPHSMNIVDQQTPARNTKQERLDKALIQFSSRRMVIQIIIALTYPPIILYYGINYLGQCPVQPLINIFLIVNGGAGIVGAADLILAFITAKYITQSLNPSPRARRLFVVCLIGQLVYLVFTIVWLVPGQVWVFGTQVNGFQSTNTSQTATYCASQVFSTGFGIIITTYSIFLIIILIGVIRYVKERHRKKQQRAVT
jgi:hypothetical protein